MRPATAPSAEAELSLYQLLDPAVLADPYPLYRRLRERDPVHWDPFLHAYVVTRYEDVKRVLLDFSAARTPTPEQLTALGLERLAPVAAVMVRQMLFLDAPAHTRLRALCSAAFTPRRVEALRAHIQEIVARLLDRVAGQTGMEVMADFAGPMPAIVTAEMLGVPSEDHPRLRAWSTDFAEMLGNFQHNPDRIGRVLAAVEAMGAYFTAAIRERRRYPAAGLIQALMDAEVEGARLSDDEIVANCIVTMVGGQETTTNLIGNGLVTLLRHPQAWRRLRDDPSVLPSAVEELLRFESPSQHTARLARTETELGDRLIRPRQAVIAVMGAANRDPERFPDPDRLDLCRSDNRHLAFGWAAHFCFGAALARMEGQIAFAALAHRFPRLELAGSQLAWRSNLGLRGLVALPVLLSGKQGSAARDDYGAGASRNQ